MEYRGLKDSLGNVFLSTYKIAGYHPILIDGEELIINADGWTEGMRQLYKKNELGSIQYRSRILRNIMNQIIDNTWSRVWANIWFALPLQVRNKVFNNVTSPTSNNILKVIISQYKFINHQVSHRHLQRCLSGCLRLGKI